MGQSSNSSTYTLFLSQDVEIDHLFALWETISEVMADFQNCHIWVWNLHAWPLAKIPEVAHILPSPRGSKLSSFSLYGQRFLRYWLIFKTVIYFGINSRSFTYSTGKTIFPCDAKQNHASHSTTLPLPWHGSICLTSRNAKCDAKILQNALQDSKNAFGIRIWPVGNACTIAYRAFCFVPISPA